jgi:hypothetical protein
MANRKPKSAQTKAKISRALKGKKRKIGAVAGAAAVGGLGYIGLKTLQKNSGKGLKSMGNNQSMRTIAGQARGNSPIALLSAGKGNKEITLPTEKLQTAQIAVMSKPNIVSQSGAMVAKVPGAKNTYMVGQQARMGYEKGPSPKTQSRMNKAAGTMGRTAGKAYGTIRKWTSRGKS